MQYREYGKQNPKTVVLLHGGGLSWWHFRAEAELLQDTYHVILPVLDGHAGSDRHYTSIEDNAAALIAFIREMPGGSVDLLGGVSLGAQTVLEMLAQSPDICKHAFAESAMVLPSRITECMIGPAFGCCFPLIRQKWFARLQFRSLHIQEELFDEYYRDTCAIEKSDMIAFLKANTAYSLKPAISETTAQLHLFAGARENRRILRSLDTINNAVQGSKKTVIPNLYHGEFSINHPEEYVRTIKRILQK